MTALALLGYSRAPSFGWILLWAVPLGLGAGAVDAALNHLVATHYRAHHMNWLHCFWGLGAMAGPLVMARFIAEGGAWRGGYLTVSLVQGTLLAILVASVRLWREVEGSAAVADPLGAGPGAGGGQDAAPHDRHRLGLRALLRLPGIYPLLAAFLLYCGIELTVGLWGTSFLVKARAFDPVDAAFGASLFYGSLTLGRALSGFLSMKMSEASLVRWGLLVVVAGGFVMLAFPSPGPAMASLALVGLGCAPIYPAMLHQTPGRYGQDWAPVLMGIQMAVAYTGATLLPPLFGWVTRGTAMGLLPVAVLAYAAVMLACTERVNRPLREGAPASRA